MAEETQEEKTPEGGKKKSKALLFVVIGLAVLLVACGGFAFVLLGSGSEEHGEVAEPEPVLKVAKLDTFIVNLSEASAFAKITMLLEYDQNILDHALQHGAGGGHGYGGGAAGGGGGSDPTALPPLMKAREPMIRDGIIKVLSSKRTADVLSTEGKEKLKEELIAVVNEAVGIEEGPITNIYFVEFIIQ